MKFNNLVEEYLFSRKLEEVKENLIEISDIEQIQRCICIGFCILYSFTKKPDDFKAVCQMTVDLVEDSAIRAIDVEEG